MKITAIMGSNRSGGQTTTVLDYLLSHLTNYEITRIDINEVRVEPCIGCDYCLANQGKCILNDDMINIYPLLMNCDVLIMALPVYFSTFPSKLKALIDRCQLIYNLKTKNAQPAKKFVSISIGGAPHYYGQFDGLALSYSALLPDINARMESFITCSNTDKVPAIQNPELTEQLHDLIDDLRGIDSSAAEK